ncbi:PREDICTED: uncharacterized protein LOC105557748 [Vollenhovia emeryi]|uniref:uncharacterized protein LOC105557748 n=1 Tax=Vollenhovia emeryi TaxID=411798 RepID=UPI0005F4CD9E|nr:PREDICTED: uncharacterized protein LOC105557748 [Vollenhovia emeryi]
MRGKFFVPPSALCVEYLKVTEHSFDNLDDILFRYFILFYACTSRLLRHKLIFPTRDAIFKKNVRLFTVLQSLVACGITLERRDVRGDAEMTNAIAQATVIWASCCRT